MSPVCQHIFCRVCVARAVELSPTCPIDRSPLTMAQLVDAPRIVQQMVDELPVWCPNRARGCEAKLERGLLDSHVKLHCTAKKRRDKKGKGKAADPSGAELDPAEATRPCQYCQMAVATLSAQVSCRGSSHCAAADSGSWQSHELACSSSSTTCRHCETNIMRSAIASHNLECPSIVIPCPHARHGCPAQLARSLMVEEHLEVSCAYEPLKEYLERQELRLVEMESENKVLSARCSGLEEGMQEMRAMLEGMRLSMGAFYVGDVPQSTSVARPAAAQSRQASFSSPSTARPAACSPPAAPHLSPHSAPLPLSTSPSASLTSPHLQQDPFAFLPVDGIQPELESPAAPLSTVVTDLQSSISSLSTAISSLEARQSANLMNETLRIQDDVQSVRAVIHGLRLQMHYLLMEVGRVTGGTGPGRGMGTGAHGAGGPGGGMPASSDSNESTSDDEQGGATGMMGMGMGMGMGIFPPGGPRFVRGVTHPGMGPRTGPLMYQMGGMKL